jgi:hypothetical protein
VSGVPRGLSLSGFPKSHFWSCNQNLEFIYGDLVGRSKISTP